MPIENIIILLAAWITSLGLVSVIMFRLAQADAAQEKLASEWALSRRDRQRLAMTAALSARDAKHRLHFG
jgi:hypothetical protein